MEIVTPGFTGRPRPEGVALPPGQYLTDDFPVLSATTTPRIDPAGWSVTVTTEHGVEHRWSWTQLLRLPQEKPVVDIHCVTRWSKLGTSWKGVSIDTLLADVESMADYAMVGCEGGYTTNLPLSDLLGGKAWLVHTYEGAPLHPVHGGPVRLLVPGLYFWKSAKWVTSIRLATTDSPGFWERLGYHDRGDPWREQRYQGDL
ncbi:molybdopterin-dependent oxidoreductase [Cellulomonas sp. PhB143]|uniref:molybdopterin-dependent oxidoreductase n=1 Tax=Cellulomonas sp. PhB143 TaxID=2485186 RepID=UPI000F45FFE4|nr:molybdopterin-dependent oxidoreductase [Cellulomonas sp. PhB143]ROS73352.1 DMSO/TMAO reductase YedYZ molybdopterin-dependent catalytic subunit [Cellulomonas sp. PhB143]